MEINNKFINQLYLNKILCLVIIAFLGLLSEFFFKDFLLFSLSWRQNRGFTDSLAALPVILIFFVTLQHFIKSRGLLNILTPLFYLFLFLALSPKISIGFCYILFFIALFFIESFSKKYHFLGSVLLGIIILLAAIPMYFYSFKVNMTPLQIYYLVVLKSCLLMRVLSWYIDRRVYKRVSFKSFWEFIEFIFCPVFFIFPGQIQFFMFDYFQKSKQRRIFETNFIHIIWLGVWGFFLMILYSKLDYFFWQHYNQIPMWIKAYGFWSTQFIIGLFWLFLVYFQQTAGMSYQVALARLMGYDFKYDMHWPLLARSPLDYLRRHSSYVRDYIVEMGLKPISLFAMRKGWKPAVVIPAASVLSYSFFISLQSGYRPDYNRSWSVTLTMILFLMLFISLPYLHGLSRKTFFKNHGQSDNLMSHTQFKSLKLWTLKDYGMWLGTLILLAVYKMFLGLTK